jgi:uncharacterized protein YoxC
MEMRKPALVALIAVVVLLLGATGVLFQKYQRASNDFAQLQASEVETRNRYGQAINEIAVIQDSLNAIVLGDEAARLQPSELNSEQQLSNVKGDAALERIALLKAGIERTKEKIEILDANLKQSNVKISGLTKMVNNLKKNVAAKEAEVNELVAKVQTLETQVTGLTAEVQENETTIQAQGTTIEEKRSEIATVYYVVGSKKELTESGMVASTGGLLGIGKTLEPTGNANQAMLTPLDTDYQTTIRIPSEKVEILSAQPSDSYELAVEEGETVLRILKPEEFRKVKHLLIMTA